MRNLTHPGRWLAACVTAALLLASPAIPSARAQLTPAEPAATTTSAKAYIVVDDKTGRILAGSHFTDKLQVASLTKIATAMVVLDWLRYAAGHTIDELATVPPNAVGVTSGGGLEPGEEVSIRDLLYAALLQSDNVAADTLAEYVGRDLLRAGGEPTVSRGSTASSSSATVRFVAEMNALARQLKMERTRFLNPSGVDGAERPYSTAADMARLTRYAVAKADFRFFVSQKERRISIKRAGAATDFMVKNTNQLLGSHRIDGVKTGSTARAGECLVLSAARDPIVKVEGSTSHITPRRIIVVLLGSANRFSEGTSLIDRGTTLYDQWAASGYPDDPKQTL